MLGVGDTGSCIQLLAPLNADSTIAKFLDRSGPGIQQVAYGVDDVEAAADALRAAGVRLLYETAQVGTAGSLVNFCHPKDCGGVLIELVQAAPGGRHFDRSARTAPGSGPSPRPPCLGDFGSGPPGPRALTMPT